MSQKPTPYNPDYRLPREAGQASPEGTFRLRDLLLAVMPAVLLGGFLSLCWVIPEESSFYRPYMLVIVVGGAVVAFYALAMVVILVRSARRNRSLAEDVDVLRRRNRLLTSQIMALQSQVELLAAMREVSRLASDDVRFERIATDILKIVGDLVDARELTLFVFQGDGEKLTPQAQRIDGRTLFGSKIGPVRADAEAAVKHHSILRTVEHDIMDVLVPLFADQEPLGVLHLAVPIEGDAVERTERAELTERVLADVATHVALAVKTTALHKRAVMDGATRLFNKTYLMEMLNDEMASTRQAGQSLSMVMLDIDHFKIINDTFGHPTGDRVLVELAARLKKNLRRDDTAYRYGGEEMVVLLPGAALGAAEGLAERIRKRIETRKFRTTGREAIDVTISLGVAELTESMKTPEDFISATDRALYAAKAAGRNCVRIVDGDKP